MCPQGTVCTTTVLGAAARVPAGSKWEAKQQTHDRTLGRGNRVGRELGWVPVKGGREDALVLESM